MDYLVKGFPNISSDEWSKVDESKANVCSLLSVLFLPIGCKQTVVEG